MNSKKNSELTFDLEALGTTEHETLEELKSSSELLLLYLENDALIVQEGVLLGLDALVSNSSEIKGRISLLNEIHGYVSSFHKKTQSKSLQTVSADVLASIKREIVCLNSELN